MSWTASATAVSGNYKNFKDLADIVTQYADVEEENIRKYFNEFMIETSLNFHKLEYKTQTITGVSADLDIEIISVKEVYVDAERIPTISWEDLKEENLTTQGYCIQNRTIYFNNTIASEVVTLLCSIERDSIAEISSVAVLDVPNTYILLAAYWILKEYYSTKTSFDATQAVRFERKYEEMKLTIYDNNVFKESRDWMKQVQNYNFDISSTGSTQVSDDYS